MSERTPYEAEIHDLHDFFAGWFSGALPDDEASYSRFSDVVTDDFTFIGPHKGNLTSGVDLLKQIRSGHGTRPGLRITIEDVRLLHAIGETLICSYIEKQSMDESETTRRSTVVFVPAPSAPNGLLWAHVHETWIDR